MGRVSTPAYNTTQVSQCSWGNCTETAMSLKSVESVGTFNSLGRKRPFSAKYRSIAIFFQANTVSRPGALIRIEVVQVSQELFLFPGKHDCHRQISSNRFHRRTHLHS